MDRVTFARRNADGAFGWLRGVRDRAIMLKLSRKDRSTVAFAYAWLEGTEFDPSEKISLKFGNEKVKITDRNLNRPARPNMPLFDDDGRRKDAVVIEGYQRELIQAILRDGL